MSDTRWPNRARSPALLLTLLLVGSVARAEGPADALLAEPGTDTTSATEAASQAAAFEASLVWKEDDVRLGDGFASLTLPSSWRALGPEDAQKVLVNAWGNPPSAQPPLAMLFPKGSGALDPDGWAVVIQWKEDGYVSDEDAKEIDYDELLGTMQKQTRDENGARKAAGYAGVDLIGWAAPPTYDARTHKMFWAKELSFDGEAEHTLNLDIRALGRRGILVLSAVASMRQLAVVQAEIPTILEMVRFNQGHRYADFDDDSDKVAGYGLAALVAGGVAVKAGLWKGLLVGLIAAKKLIFVGIAALIGVFARWKKGNQG